MKTVPEIKNDLEELRFGCKLYIQNYITPVIIIWDNRRLCVTEWTEYTDFLGQTWTYTQSFSEKHIEKIIWNPIQRHHLECFMDKKYGRNWRIIGVWWQVNIQIHKESEVMIQAIDYDYRFWLNNQTEEFYKKLYLFLKK